MTIEDRIAKLESALTPLIASEVHNGWVSAKDRQKAILAVGQELLFMLRAERTEYMEAQR